MLSLRYMSFLISCALSSQLKMWGRSARLPKPKCRIDSGLATEILKRPQWNRRLSFPTCGVKSRFLPHQFMAEDIANMAVFPLAACISCHVFRSTTRLLGVKLCISLSCCWSMSMNQHFGWTSGNVRYLASMQIVNFSCSAELASARSTLGSNDTEYIPLQETTTCFVN
jgi:hypothetical protein